MIVGIASRDLAKAESVVEAFKVGVPYGSYESLLQDPNIDAVYIPLPNDQHKEWAIQAMRHGKHVLCEKPLALSVGDIDALIAVRNETKLLISEAFMTRHHPQWELVRDMINAKNERGSSSFGELVSLQCVFSYVLADPSNIRLHPQHGGGALMDIGVYPIAMARYLLRSEPKRVMTTSVSWNNVDESWSAMLAFEKVTLHFTVSMNMPRHQRFYLYGTKQLLEMEIPFNAVADQAMRIKVQEEGKEERYVNAPPVDQYQRQIEEFSRAVQSDSTLPFPLEDARANMRVVEALQESEKQGKVWIDL